MAGRGKGVGGLKYARSKKEYNKEDFGIVVVDSRELDSRPSFKISPIKLYNPKYDDKIKELTEKGTDNALVYVLEKLYLPTKSEGTKYYELIYKTGEKNKNGEDIYKILSMKDISQNESRLNEFKQFFLNQAKKGYYFAVRKPKSTETVVEESKSEPKSRFAPKAKTTKSAKPVSDSIYLFTEIKGEKGGQYTEDNFYKVIKSNETYRTLFKDREFEERLVIFNRNMQPDKDGDKGKEGMLIGIQTYNPNKPDIYLIVKLSNGKIVKVGSKDVKFASEILKLAQKKKAKEGAMEKVAQKKYKAVQEKKVSKEEKSLSKEKKQDQIIESKKEKSLSKEKIPEYDEDEYDEDEYDDEDDIYETEMQYDLDDEGYPILTSAEKRRLSSQCSPSDQKHKKCWAKKSGQQKYGKCSLANQKECENMKKPKPKRKSPPKRKLEEEEEIDIEN